MFKIQTNKKIVLFDIETTNLAANYGYIICACWKYLGEKKIHTISVEDSPTFEKDPTNDKYVVKKIVEDFKDAQILISWYGKRFDIPFINTRLLKHNLKPLPDTPHVDGCIDISRYKLKLNSNRLQTVTSFFGFEDKTPIKPEFWIKAMAGNKKAIGYVKEHCIQDIKVLEDVYIKIRPLHTTHPNINLIDEKLNACPVCGEQKLQKNGIRIARTARRQRYRCLACGASSCGKTKSVKGINVR